MLDYWEALKDPRNLDKLDRFLKNLACISACSAQMAK